MSFWKSIGNIFKTAAKRGFSPFAWVSALFKGITGNNLPFEDEFDSLLKGKTGSGLTNAQIQQNDWNAEQAQISRDWQEQMDNTKFQRQVSDMQAAGLNPSMLYGSSVGVSSPPSGATASGSSVAPPTGLVDSILNIVFAKERLNNLRSETRLRDSEAKAALMNAFSNYRNATSGERQATVAEIRAGIEKTLSEKDIELKDSQINKMSADMEYTRTVMGFVEKNYDIALKNANSLERQSIAALRQADAAVQNAATQSYLADYSADLQFSQTLLNEIVKGEHEEIYKNLPERLRNEIDNLRKQGLVLDEQKRLVHRQGNLATANTIASYVGIATDVARTVASFVPGASGAASGGSNLAPYIVGSGASLTFP